MIFWKRYLRFQCLILDLFLLYLIPSYFCTQYVIFYGKLSSLCSLNRSLNLVEPVYCLLHILQVSRYTTHILLQSKWKFILKTSPVTVLLNSFPGSNILHISQLLFLQGKFPLSSSSFSLILDLPSLLRNVFGLRIYIYICIYIYIYRERERERERVRFLGYLIYLP